MTAISVARFNTVPVWARLLNGAMRAYETEYRNQASEGGTGSDAIANRIDFQHDSDVPDLFDEGFFDFLIGVSMTSMRLITLDFSASFEQALNHPGRTGGRLRRRRSSNCKSLRYHLKTDLALFRLCVKQFHKQRFRIVREVLKSNRASKSPKIRGRYQHVDR